MMKMLCCGVTSRVFVFVETRGRRSSTKVRSRCRCWRWRAVVESCSSAGTASSSSTNSPQRPRTLRPCPPPIRHRASPAGAHPHPSPLPPSCTLPPEASARPCVLCEGVLTLLTAVSVVTELLPRSVPSLLATKLSCKSRFPPFSLPILAFVVLKS